MGSPSASARASDFNTTTPTPSPRTYLSARASKGLQRPSAAIKPALEKAMVGCGDRMRLDPPTSARVLSPARRLAHARCSATNDDEQAVSTARLGPRKSSVYE